MDHGRLVALLLLCPKFLFARNEDRICFPDRVQGHTLALETGTSTYFAIDFERERFLSENQPDGQSFRIVDFGSGERHTFNGNNCSTVPFSEVDLFEQCIHDDLHLPDLPLGELHHPFEVNAIGYRTSGRTRLTLITKVNGHHLPFFTQDIHDDGTVKTGLSYGVSSTLGYKNRKLINSDVSDCVHENWLLS